MTACPCCGAPVEADPLAEAMRAVTPLMREIVGYLARHPGRVVQAREIADWVHRDDPDGGPICAHESVQRIISTNRPRLRPHGFDVLGQPGPEGGYELRAYRSNQPGQSQ
jgi:hypothetical protein